MGFWLNSRLGQATKIINPPIISNLVTKKRLQNTQGPSLQGLFCWRGLSALPKRFYRKVGIVEVDGRYEIILDQRRLRTPSGAVLQVANEALAQAVAAEWDSQTQHIQRAHMHLTALCSTVMDNPNKVTKFDLVQNICNYLDTDTVLFHSKEEAGLYELQQSEWQPLVDWVGVRFGATLRPSLDIGPPSVDDRSRAAIHRHLMSHNFAAVHGFAFAVEALKSCVLTLACVERAVPVDRAVLLSRLEEEYQVGHWGRVEWAHDLSQLDLQARVSAAVLFAHLNSCSARLTAKQTPTDN